MYNANAKIKRVWRSVARNIFPVLIWSLLFVWALAFMVLLIWGIITSVKSSVGFYIDPVFFPKGKGMWAIKNYLVAFQNIKVQVSNTQTVGFVTMLINSLLFAVGNAFFSVLSVAFAFAVRAIINGAVEGDRDKLVAGIIFIISLVVLQFAFRIINNALSEHIRGRLEIAFRSRIFSVILDKKYSEIKGYHSGELINRLTSTANMMLTARSMAVTTFMTSLSVVKKANADPNMIITTVSTV